jgi:hypothetical protein
MAGQVALSAVILRSCGAGRLAMRVCMWTGSIVLLITDLILSIGQVAFYCGSEVLLGAIIGAAFHWAEAVVLPLVIRPVDPACKWASSLPLNHGYQIASVRFRPISPLPMPPGESRLTRSTADPQPVKRELARAWILVEKPPRERPRACFCVPPFAPAAQMMGPDDGAVDGPG